MPLQNDIINNYLQGLIPQDAGLSPQTNFQRFFQNPTIRPDWLNMIIDAVARLNPSPESVLGNLSLAGDLIPFKVVSSTEAAPKIEEAIRNLNKSLKANDYLGFDYLHQARRAIRDHPDWIQRWGVSDSELIKHGSDYVRSVNNQINLEKLGMTKDIIYTAPSWDEVWRSVVTDVPSTPSEIVNKATDKLSNILQFKPKVP